MPDGWFDAMIRPYYPERSEVPDISEEAVDERRREAG